jgi:hypothetical protein
MFAVNAILLLAYHVHAQGLLQQQQEESSDKSNDDDSIKRLLNSRINNLTIMDMLLFGTFVLMSMELLDFCSSHSGSKYMNVRYVKTKRTPRSNGMESNAMNGWNYLDLA